MSDFFVRSIDNKSRDYCETYLMFDDYSASNSLKDGTRQHRTAGRAHSRGYKVEDTTRIKDLKTFLASKETKANLVLYLANKAVNLCKLPITTHTHKGVQSSRPDMVNIVSRQEEADTLLILYAVAVSRLGKVVHIYACDTDVLVLALHRVPELSPYSAIIMGTGDQRRKIKLKPIYDSLGPAKAAALPGFHALSGADNTGHIRGKGKSTCFKAFLRAGVDVTSAIAGLGVGAQPSDSVVSGCEEFVCQLFNSNIATAKALRWHMFKQLKSNLRCRETVSHSRCHH